MSWRMRLFILIGAFVLLGLTNTNLSAQSIGNIVPSPQLDMGVAVGVSWDPEAGFEFPSLLASELRLAVRMPFLDLEMRVGQTVILRFWDFGVTYLEFGVLTPGLLYAGALVHGWIKPRVEFHWVNFLVGLRIPQSVFLELQLWVPKGGFSDPNWTWSFNIMAGVKVRLF